MAVTCRHCGQTWPRDPAMEVACPACFAGIGSPCRRPSGHGCATHAARDQLAMDRGFLVACTGIPAQPRLPAVDDDARQMGLL